MLLIGGISWLIGAALMDIIKSRKPESNEA